MCAFEGGNITSAGWQVILCDPIWHMSSRSGEASCELLYSVYLYIYLNSIQKLCHLLMIGLVTVFRCFQLFVFMLVLLCSCVALSFFGE